MNKITKTLFSISLMAAIAFFMHLPFVNFSIPPWEYPSVVACFIISWVGLMGGILVDVWSET